MNGRLGARTIAVVAAVVVAVVVVAVVVVLGRRDDGRNAVGAPQSVATVRVNVTPRVHAFGEQIVAEVVGVFDREYVVPGSIQVNARFDPYQFVSPLETDTDEIGRLLRVRYRYTLDCLSEECTPTEGAAASAIELPPGRIAYRYRGTAGRAGQTIRWPLLRVTSRLSAPALEAGRWRADPRIVPAASYSVSPGVLAGVLLTGSILLLLLAGAIGWRLIAPRVQVAAGPEVDTRPPLERALELARAASQNGSAPDRRKALERLARELGGVGLGDLADRARTLAWSPAGPSPDAVEQLARDARAAHEGTPA